MNYTMRMTAADTSATDAQFSILASLLISPMQPKKAGFLSNH